MAGQASDALRGALRAEALPALRLKGADLLELRLEVDALFLEVLSAHRAQLGQQRVDLEAQLKEIGAFEAQCRKRLGAKGAAKGV